MYKSYIFDDFFFLKRCPFNFFEREKKILDKLEIPSMRIYC